MIIVLLSNRKGVLAASELLVPLESADYCFQLFEYNNRFVYQFERDNINGVANKK